MSQLERKWIQDYAVNNQKVDPTDTYTITGLQVDGTNAVGRVGIGTNDPLGALHIRRTDTSVGMILDLDDNTNGRNYCLLSDSGGAFKIRDGTDDRFNITSTGNIGIGTAFPGAPLHVEGNIFTSYGADIGNNSHRIGTIYMASAINYSSNLNFNYGGSTKLTLGTNGCVGIGTAFPYRSLQVEGGDISTDGTVSCLSLEATNKSFKIDHPLDPENKYLYHSTVESPERRNIYFGQATTNNGSATIKLPDWWMALNGTDKNEYVYLSMPIGEWHQLYVSKEIEDNQFEISSADGDCRFSWSVSAIRHDAVAENNEMEVEVLKVKGFGEKHTL